MQPEAYRLNAVNWDFFATLTWPQRWIARAENRASNQSLGHHARGLIDSLVIKTHFAFLRDVSSRVGVHMNRLLWVSRIERGEQTGRLHTHMLIAGKRSHVIESKRWAIKALWKSHSGAFADVRFFDRALPGVGYVLKAGDTNDGANRYEMGKFGLDSSTVTFSRSCLKAIKVRLAADVRNAE